ncbi:SulP family inorganic anion transporter [Arcicella sp. DC2W]|uniref:SulP family inorganic anion transporter n=1 Tax=Arcicella gelida TaxID=2984195 RepID=A0ABU5S4B6_9BACT|nr:SulP family inorganic anion transporter [Arcicella sp. DC2W]MEA5403348.1 SulP family inorganic anion transporter [Arcicella sp. DC2W]
MSKIKYYQKSLLETDWKSGISVFLVALPLCLGIALASGAPLFAGLLSGIVAGIVVSILSGSEISVSGPAAGLTVIVATAIKDLGSYPGFLVAVILAGLLQIALGYLKAGKFSAYFPESVIKGMLVAIGLVIILKQIPHALGDDQDYEGEFEFEQVADHQNTITELIRSFVDFNYGAVIISFSCLSLLIFWDYAAKKNINFFKVFPSALAAVLLGVSINEIYAIAKPEYFLGNSPIHMVAMPIFNNFQEFKSVLIFPDFSFLSNPHIYTIAITLAIVASLESLLSLEAGDSIDPQKRISSSDKELVAQGVGNTITGLLGGLPVTSVVVRTSANVYAGAKTRMSSIVHGVLLLASVVFIPMLMNRIPLSALAAILLMVGYKLANPVVFKKVYKEGYDQYIPFAATIIIIIFKDLLFGIFIGTFIGLLFVVFTNFRSVISVIREGNNVLIKFNKDVSFLNKPRIKNILMSLKEGDEVLIDGARANFIDHDIFTLLYTFKRSSKSKGIEVVFKKVNRKIQGDINHYHGETESSH